MVKKVDVALVKLWEHTVGAVVWLSDQNYAIFEYDASFLKQELDVAPIHMSVGQARQGDGKFFFPSLERESFLGLPGMLADSLPDKFGNRLIDAWLTRQGRDIATINPIERLCYIGKRGMGALEFTPSYTDQFNSSVPIEVAELVLLAQKMMHERALLNVHLNQSEKNNSEAFLNILRVGSSAGGARPKAIIAMNASGHILSGQTDVPNGYDYWILKFDGVTDIELGEPRGYGRIEYAYHLMAKAAGITMTECRLLEEHGRAHFMTRRFDREAGKKIHLQSLCGIAHYDFNMSGAYGYEQAFAIMRQLRLSHAEAIEQYRRMVFNILARNLDDHTKNIAFLMRPNGKWSLSPAYDVTYSHNPAGKWTNQHQMSLNGKRDDFTLDDLMNAGTAISISDPQFIITEVATAIADWLSFATTAGVNKDVAAEIGKQHLKFKGYSM